MALKGKSDNGNQLYLHYKYDSSTLSFSIKDVATICSAHSKEWAPPQYLIYQK